LEHHGAEARTVNAVVEAGETLIRQVLEAIPRQREAVASGSPEHEVKRLHILADSLHQTVIDFQR